MHTALLRDLHGGGEHYPLATLRPGTAARLEEAFLRSKDAREEDAEGTGEMVQQAGSDALPNRRERRIDRRGPSRLLRLREWRQRWCG